MGRRLLIVGFCLMVNFFNFSWSTENDFDGFLHTGQTYLQQGQYFLALDDLRSAQDLAVTPEQQAQASGMLGLTHYQMRHREQAEALLRQALDSGADADPDRARWMATLADLQANRGQREEARILYADAAKLAGDNPGLRASIRLGQAALLAPEQRLAELARIHDSLEAITEPTDHARYLLDLGTQAQESGGAGLKLAYACFQQARQELDDQQPRLLADALGGLAQLYEDQKRHDESSRLNQQAIRLAQGIDAHDLLLDLEWRQARLYRNMKQPTQALAAYQRAVEHIEAIRQDIPVEYNNGRSSFRETLEPVYLGLADVLLAEASHASGEDKTVLLRRARETVELIKQSELEDFLGGRCAVHRSKGALLEAVDPTTAIIYPILLPERLELLVTSGNEIRQYTQSIQATNLKELAHHLALSLRSGEDDIKSVSGQLYAWLIAPIEPWLHQRHVQTLVMVPDGILRLIPPAALYDGEHYLIENYALAISPGLTLFESAPLQQHGVKVLLAGMSEPGAVVEHLPPIIMQEFANDAERGVKINGKLPSSRALPMSLTDPGATSNQTRGMDVGHLNDPAVLSRIKEQLKLPGVVQEMDTLRQELPNTFLMNDTFTVAEFNREVGLNPYSVVHVASHGIFGSTADTSFVMAHDNIININDLERLFKSRKFEQQPVELLTLSACQTAEGDDRAPMGLSGIALKARVRSTLGTLWPISDEAAPFIMGDFYKALLQPGVSKAQALRQAQISLIKNKKLANPFFWSPFILVGNWQ